MNNPVKASTCEADMSYCRFGCETIVDLLEGFEENIDGVLENKDVECIHKTRVISRRLRAALPLFKHCFPSKRYKRWLKEVKKVTRLLGEARDLDVQIAFLEKYLKNGSLADKEYINLLLNDRTGRRNSVQPLIGNGIGELKASGILESIENFCKETVAVQATVSFDPNRVLEKAQWHISLRLDDFLSLEKYVHIEDADSRHHEMRINAKKLRYTMEFFAPLYPNKLKDEIETVKTYQDILGEKHDLEVWIAYLPKFIKETKLKNSKSLDNVKFDAALKKFFTYIRDQRKDHYAQFVKLWENNQKKKFFSKLRETTKPELTLTEEKANQILANPDVKVAVMSDIHANLYALEAVIRDAEERGIDIFLNAGDSIGFGAYPNEVVELLSEKNVLSVLGNYDLEVIENEANAKGVKRTSFKFTKNELAKSCQRYLYSLPRELKLQASGIKLLVTHGSPESIDEHISRETPLERLRALAETANADVIIVGHSHEQFWRKINGAAFINSGSVGRPSDANPQAAYAVLKFNPLKAELIRVTYDVGDAAQALRKKGLPESLSQMLLRGVAVDTIVAEDKTREKLILQNIQASVQASKTFAEARGLDEEHYGQVTRLALEFFDGLTKLHKLGEAERCWLQCAAILHDVGLPEGRRGHNKVSAEIILNAAELPFSSRERRIIASIARYHRKGLPKSKHYNLKALDRDAVSTIKVLSSLLRVADALDFTHTANAVDLKFKIGTKKVTAECSCKTKSPLEERAFNSKKDLFEGVFAKKLVLVWKQHQ